MRFLFILFIVFLAGCQTTALQKKENAATVKSIKEAQSAVESLKGAVTPTQVRVRYCPVCGRRFSPSVNQCPFDKTELKELE